MSEIRDLLVNFYKDREIILKIAREKANKKACQSSKDVPTPYTTISDFYQPYLVPPLPILRMKFIKFNS